MRRIVGTLVLAAAFASAASWNVAVDTTQPTTPFPHFWKRCFGSGHARLGLRADWQQQLSELQADIGVERLRFHGIFDDDMSVVLDTVNNYEFFNVDQVYDAMLAKGIRPVVELSFMPGLLAGCSPWNTTGQPCQYVMHYHGIVMTPTDWNQWTNLVQAFAEHLVGRYGINEVSQWHFEVWNELWGMPYPNDYLQLYDASRAALKKVSPLLQVGGPVTMQCQYVKEFVNDRKGQFDFVSTHLYPTDPNCTVPGNDGYGDIDCFAHTILKARSQAPADMPFFMTEYNAGLFVPELLYSKFAASFIFRNVPQLAGKIDMWSYWTFTDIFEESGMHSAPFEGFNYGIQTNRGIKKPAYRAFELLHKKAGRETFATAVSPQPSNATVTAFATPAADSTSRFTKAVVFVSNFAPQQFAIEQATVNVSVHATNSSKHLCTATVSLIDSKNANPYGAWTLMGSPAYPTEWELSAMKDASVAKPLPVLTFLNDAGDCTAVIDLEPHAAAVVEFNFL